MKKGIDLPSLWWADVKGYEGLYQVSVDGEMKSLERISPQGHLLKESIMKPWKTKKGYLTVCLCKDGKYKHHRVHRLVAQAFIPNDDPKHKTQINHINEDKTDNRVENLEWVTPKENTNWGTCVQRRAENNRNGKLSKPVVALDKQGRIVHVFPSTMEAGRNGYTQTSVAACCRGKKGYNTHHGLIWKYQDDVVKKTDCSKCH